MIGYYTDNNVSHTAMKSFSRRGIPVKHIRDFDNTQPGIFYGILRGTGTAMLRLKDRGIDFWYVDNGYFDAVYMNEGKKKDMGGTYRIVKNDLIQPVPDWFPIHKKEPDRPLRFMLMPPSPYTAFMHDTTPEDWEITWGQKLHNLGHTRKKRDKTETIPLETDLSDVDAVLAFNSMGVVKAIEKGKAVYTTHGIIRNSHLIGKEIQYFHINDIKNFYEPNQYTLEEIADQGVKCLR